MSCVCELVFVSVWLVLKSCGLRKFVNGWFVWMVCLIDINIWGIMFVYGVVIIYCVFGLKMICVCVLIFNFEEVVIGLKCMLRECVCFVDSGIIWVFVWVVVCLRGNVISVIYVLVVMICLKDMFDFNFWR